MKPTVLAVIAVCICGVLTLGLGSLWFRAAERHAESTARPQAPHDEIAPPVFERTGSRRSIGSERHVTPLPPPGRVVAADPERQMAYDHMAQMWDVFRDGLGSAVDPIPPPPGWDPAVAEEEAQALLERLEHCSCPETPVFVSCEEFPCLVWMATTYGPSLPAGLSASEAAASGMGASCTMSCVPSDGLVWAGAMPGLPPPDDPRFPDGISPLAVPLTADEVGWLQSSGHDPKFGLYHSALRRTVDLWWELDGGLDR